MRSSLLAYAKLRYFFRTYKLFSQKHNVHPAISYKDENFSISLHAYIKRAKSIVFIGICRVSKPT